MVYYAAPGNIFPVLAPPHIIYRPTVCNQYTPVWIPTCRGKKTNSSSGIRLQKNKHCQFNVGLIVVVGFSNTTPHRNLLNTRNNNPRRNVTN